MQTLTLDGRRFEPLNPERVTVYVCGPTVYQPPHLGNLRSAVNFDVLHRVLKRLYPEVVFVRNYTDIDDKIMDAAKAQGLEIDVITNEAIEAYEGDLKYLNVLPPTHAPRVTDSLDDIRAFIYALVANGSAYEKDGHVLFDRQRNPTFHLNTNINPDDLAADGGASYKRHPHDFVLWKPSRDDQPGWASPWGYGRPGWHIECSAMILHTLGETIDIHGGGTDLKFPHHENECAQSVALTGRPLANYWLHNGMLDFGGKMSKERGNVIYMRAGPMPWDGQSGLLSLYGSDTVRYFLMTAHYRQPLTYTEASLDRAEISMRSLRRALAKYAFERPREIAYVGGLADDLNTPRAISEAHALANVINRGEETTEQVEQYYSLMDALGMVGLFSRVVNPHDHEVEEMMQQRTMARDRRDFAEADRLRDLILARGVEVNDAPLKG